MTKKTPTGVLKQTEAVQVALPTEEIELASIIAKPEEFSPRHVKLDEQHVRNLMQAMARGATLDPVVVWRRGRKLTLLDGFHRVAAMRKTGGIAEVRAQVFEGDRAEALRLTVQTNAKATLQLTRTERSDWAWRLVREQKEAAEKLDRKEPTSADERTMAGVTVAWIARTADVSDRTVETMRAAWETWADEAAGHEALMGKVMIILTGRWIEDHDNIRGDNWNAWTAEQRAEAHRAHVAKLCDDHKALGVVARKDEQAVVAMLDEVLGAKAIEIARAVLRRRGLLVDWQTEADVVQN